jgi:hypothetical protein
MRTSRALFVIAAIFLTQAASLPAMELTGSFQLGNIGFTADRASTDATFTGQNLFWGGTLALSYDISDSFAVEAGFTRDPLLRNDAYTLLSYKTDYFTLGVGAFLGLFNTDSSVVKTGITISAKLGLPGVLYVFARSDTSLGSGTSLFSLLSGDYSVQGTELSVGFYVRNAILSLDLTSKDFILTQGLVQIVDSLTRYTLSIDIYRKNTPMHILVSFAYQTLSKEFLDGMTNPTATLDSLIPGVGLDIQITNAFALLANFSTSVYSWGSGLLAGVSGLGYETFLFNGSIGFRVNLQPGSQ